MRICSIKRDNQTFTAKSKSNKDCNAGKFLGTGLFVGLLSEKIISKGGFAEFANDYHKALATAIGTEISTEIKELNTPLLKRMANTNLVGSVALVAGCCIGIGAIFDKIKSSK